MNLSDNLRKIRKEEKLSQEQLAEKLGVSRQSVSKWESGLAYPEMDKIVQLCKMFNVNVDDLLNQDVSEVNNTKQAKNNINKFVDDFLNYVTKTINMFGSMTFKSKIKCLFEQCIVIAIIVTILMLIGGLGSNIFRHLFSFMTDKIYYPIFHVFEAIFIGASAVFGTALVLHIFKTRYLDYYKEVKISKEEIETETDEKNDNVEESKKENNSPKKERIVIRDPEHSEYRFISGLIKGFIFAIKAIVIFIALLFCISLVFFVICSVLSFMFAKSGLVFWGALFIIIACILVNIIMLVILYNYIVNNKSKKGLLAVSFLIALIVGGSGVGFAFIGAKDFKIIDNNDSNHFVTKEVLIDMKDDMIIDDYYSSAEYVVTDSNQIKITYTYSNFYDAKLENEGNHYSVIFSHTEPNSMDIINTFIKDINNKEIVDYSKCEVIVYANENNISKLKNNSKTYFEQLSENERNEIIEDLEERNNELETEISDKDENIENYKEQLEEKDSIIEDLREQIDSMQSN